MGVTHLTDDLDVAGHHIKDWRYLSDIPQNGAAVGQALTWQGTAWGPETIQASTSGTVLWGDIVGAPVAFPPDAHVHVSADITDLASTVLLRAAGDWWDQNDTVTYPNGFPSEPPGVLAWLLFEDGTDGHKFVENYMDCPVTYATQSALDLKASSTHTHTLFSNNVAIEAPFTFSTDTVIERTSAAGVTVGGVKLKDSEVYTDVVREKTATAGVTVDGVLLKDNTVLAANTVVGAAVTNVSAPHTLSPTVDDFYTTYINYDATDVLTAGSGADVEPMLISFNSNINLVDSGSAFFLPEVHPFASLIDANSVAQLYYNGSPSTSAGPVYFIFQNPASGQAFAEGYLSVDIAGTSGTVISAYTRARVSGSAVGIGYRGYAINASGATGTLTGVNGYAAMASGGTSTAVMAFDATLVGTSTAFDKRMSLRGSNHVLLRGGSLVLATGTPATPNAVTTTHLALSAGNSELFVGGKAEVDGELFMDGNTSISVATTTSATYNAAAATVILADATSAVITVNLPAASGKAGRLYTIKKIDASANKVTIDGNASETIDGATTKDLLAQYDVMRLVCDGANWHIV